MSIYDDIAGVSAVTIPEGSVKKITRKTDGGVIWEYTYIRFTIDGVEYTGEKYMTWDSWVSSVYNSGGFEIGENGIIKLPAARGSYVVTGVVSADVIIASASYTLEFIEPIIIYYKSTNLSGTRGGLAATTVGSYALFAVQDFINAYNESLTRSTPTALSQARGYMAATTVGSYALFAGGRTNSGSPQNVVDAYNSSLTRSTPTVLSKARMNIAATAVGAYALFGGGQDDTANSNELAVVDAYNSSLTRSTPTALSKARTQFDATTIGAYALFGGGGNGGRTYSAIVDAYNSSLTRSKPTELSVARDGVAAATVGSYALFAGGNTSTGSSSSVVDIYTEE